MENGRLARLIRAVFSSERHSLAIPNIRIRGLLGKIKETDATQAKGKNEKREVREND